MPSGAGPDSRVRGRSRRSAGGAPWFPLAFFGSIALLFLQFYTPPSHLLLGPFGRERLPLGMPDARPGPDAFGRSGGVTMRFSLPDDSIEFPLEIQGDPTALKYQWVRMADMSPVDSLRLLHSSHVRSPAQPGFYMLALARGDEARVLHDVTLAVMVPFSKKTGTALNGYRIGTYVAERKGSTSLERPDGFMEVGSADLELPLSKHFRVADFLTHDNQRVWPRYSAVSPKILDKLELVIARLQQAHGAEAAGQLTIDVHSAFRTPLYNRLQSQARESRHQYGDAVDLSIDADGDGRINSKDVRLITAAVDTVEAMYPELAGGLGVYSGIKYRSPYVHIDARGIKVRWRG